MEHLSAALCYALLRRPCKTLVDNIEKDISHCTTCARIHHMTCTYHTYNTVPTCGPATCSSVGTLVPYDVSTHLASRTRPYCARTVPCHSISTKFHHAVFDCHAGTTLLRILVILSNSSVECAHLTSSTRKYVISMTQRRTIEAANLVSGTY